jgi:hypothetical protein
MARTGNKEKEYLSLSDRWFYKRVYECKNCDKVLADWESRNLTFPGSLTTE